MNAFFSSTSFLRYFLSCTLLFGLLGSAVFALPLGATCETQNCDMGLTCENSNGQSVPPGAGPGSCVEKCDFDNFCDSGETVQYCPSDCHCGNGVCEPASPWSENSANCGQDCYCGNGTVEAGENNCTCPADVPATTCGDGCCVGTETSGTCSADCGLPPTCPNGVADPGETFCNCPDDVPQTTCGDGCCEQSETVSTCYNDCGSCGDGQCTSPETLSSCPSDCRSCGDGQCTAPWENAGNCVDCQVPSCTISGPSVCRNTTATFDCNHYYANGPISMSSANPNQTSATDSISVSFGPNAQGVATIACFNNGAQLCTTSRSIGYCGDGSTNCNEECDFGNSFPDACNPTTCEREPCTTSNDCGGGFVCVGGFCDAGYCGDGVISQGEECETNNDCAGYGNGYTCDFCGCMPPGGGGGGNPMCGNLITESGEQCDDGDGAQPGQGGTIIEMDQCDGATCTKVNVCGDGVVGLGEQCDNGGKCTKYPAGTYPPLSTDPYCNEESDCNYASNAVCAPRGGDGCSATCQNEPGRVCGDGQVAGTEQCDDGNTTNGDGCDNNCKSTGCGNGIVTGTEECDDGNLINNDGCSNICQGAFCGDGILQEKGPNGVTGGGDDEVCDDGNQVNGDGCTSDCSYCGLHCSDCSVKLSNLDIFFVVDNSASMLEGSDQNFSCADGICKLIDAKTAIEMFVNALNPAEDRVALIEFNSTATVKYPLAANTGFSSMKTAVNALQATGLTNMGGAMNTLTTLAGNYTYSNRVPVVIFLGDGQPTVPNSPDPITYAQTQAAAFHAAYPDFKVYSIGFDLQSLSTGNQAVAIDLLQNHIASTPADFYMGAPGGKGAMCGGGKGTDAATIFAGGGASLASVVGGRLGLTETYGQIWDQMCQCGLPAPRPLCSDAVKLRGASVGGAPKSGFCAGKPSLSCASNAACGSVGPCVTSNNLCGGWERYECTAPATCEGCGDGVVQAGEQCDLGNRNGTSGSGCDTFCKVTSYCGDGVVQDCEVCDDGNFIAGDGCSPYCTLEATVCGDGVINTCGALTGSYLVDGNEQGYCAGSPTTTCNAKGVDCPSGQGPCLEASYCNLGTQGTCLDDPTVACTSHFDCGDSKTASVCVGLALAQIPDPSEGGPLDVKQLCSGTEFCDDGNTTNGDSCPSTCTAVCGNGVVEGTELCDDGNTVNTDGCTNACAAATCGDNIVRTGVEQCDDGKNGDQNDGCTDQCTTGPCDPTTTYASGAVPGWSCPVDWVLQGCPGAYVCVKKTIAPIICTECGDGTKGPTEECDWSDQNDPHHEACNQFCLLNYCGDGEIFTGTNTGLVRNWIATGATSTRPVLAFSRVITQGQGGFQYTLEGGGTNSSAFAKSMSVSNLIQTQNNLFDELLVALPGHGVGNQPDHGQLLALSFDTGGKVDAIRPYFSGTLLGGNFKPLFIETLKNTSNGGGYDTIVFPWSGAILSLWGGADYLGSNTGVISISPLQAQAITDMVTLGDLDNNGIDDFAFVAPTAANDVQIGVVLTTGNPVTRLSMQTISSLGLNADMQVKMSPLGDTDSDGVEDMLLSHYDENTGQMTIKRVLLNANGSLKSQSTVQTITTNKANFSYAVYGPDIDEDGVKDIVTVRSKETPFVIDGLVLLMHANRTIKSSIVVDFGAAKAQGDTQFFPHEMIFLPDFDADADETIALGSPKSFNYKGGIYTYELQAPYGHELTGSDTIEECDAGSYCNDLTTRCEDNPSICPGGPANCQPRYIDGCTPFCQLGCGDGIVDTNGLDGLPNTADDEVCDDGNGVDSDACTNMCKRPLCGDGILTDETGWTGANGLWTEYFEMCDPAATGGTNCPNTCILTGGVNARCNYTFSAAAAYDVNSFSELENLPGSLCYPVGVPVIEGTHDTNASGVVIGWNRSCEGIGSGASSTCSLQRRSCGDGVVDAWNGTDAEECDDGNQTNGDGCTDTCQWEDMLEAPASECTVNSYPQVEEGEYLPVRWLGSWSDAVGPAGQACANASKNVILRDTLLCHADIQRGNPTLGGTDVVATELVPCGVQSTQGVGLISGALADFAPGVSITQTLGTYLFTPDKVTSWVNYGQTPLYGQYKLGVKTMGMQYCALRRTNDAGTVTGTVTELSDFEDCTNNEDDNGDGMIDCADTTRCNQTVHPHCAPNWVGGGGGGSCQSNADCQDSFVCNGLETCQNGTCVAVPPPSPWTTCQSINSNLYCSETDSLVAGCRESQRQALGMITECYEKLIISNWDKKLAGLPQCSTLTFTTGGSCTIPTCAHPGVPGGTGQWNGPIYTQLVSPPLITTPSQLPGFSVVLRDLGVSIQDSLLISHLNTIPQVFTGGSGAQMIAINLAPEHQARLNYWKTTGQGVPTANPPVYTGGGGGGGGGSGVQEICDDNIDQNGDGLMNCSAGNCSNSANCLVPWNENCFDGIDNNPTTSPGADQDDPDCFQFWESTGYEAPASLGPRTTAEVTYTATGAMCEAGFSVSKGYFVQQGFAFSEQANTGLNTANFTNIAGVSLVADGTVIDDSLNQIATYQGAGKRYLFDEFINTWSNKAVNDASIDIVIDGVRRNYTFKKVPTHHIYFYDGQANDIVVLNTAVKNAILRAGGIAAGQEGTVSFTLVLPESAQQLTIEGSMLGNGMFISQGNIKFASSTQYGCDGSDVIEGLFVAGGSFETDTIGNKNLNQDKRCKGGNLQIKGTLLGMNAGSQLAPLRRSVLNAWSTGNLLFDDSKVFQAKDLFETCYLPNLLIKKASDLYEGLGTFPIQVEFKPVFLCSINSSGAISTVARENSNDRKDLLFEQEVLKDILNDGLANNPDGTPLTPGVKRAKAVLAVLPQNSNLGMTSCTKIAGGNTMTCISVDAAGNQSTQTYNGVPYELSQDFIDAMLSAGKFLPPRLLNGFQSATDNELLYRMIAKSTDDIRQKFISFVPPIATNAAYALDSDRARSIYGALRNVFLPNLNIISEYGTANFLRKELEKYAPVGSCVGPTPFYGHNSKKFSNISDCKMSYYADFKWLVTNSVEGQQQGAQREDQIIEGSSVSISSQPKIWTDLPPGARSFLESIVVAP